MKYDTDIFHPWDRFIKALSIKKDYRGAEAFFRTMDTGETMSKELFEGLKIPTLKRTTAGISTGDLRDLGITSWNTDLTDGARALFKNKQVRETICLYLLLGLDNKEVAIELPKRHPVLCDADDIKFFKHYFWCVDNCPQASVRAHALTFNEPNRSLCLRVLDKGDVILARHELGLPLDIRDLDMLKNIRDSVYLSIIQGLDKGQGKGMATLKNTIKALTDIMAAKFIVEENMLSDEELKPLFVPTFEEATALETIEDLVRKGEEITGGESKAVLPTEPEEGK